VTPAEAVSRLTEIIVRRTDFSEDDIYAAMAAAGIPFPIADRAYKFTQIACGRALLHGLGIEFAATFTYFDGSGHVIEAGQLEDQPYFAAACAEIRRIAGSPGFKRLALMAAELHAVNDLLNKGSKPENLRISPPILFSEPLTPAGAELLLRQRLSQNKSESKKRRWGLW
jgi:hypothetical protein